MLTVEAAVAKFRAILDGFPAWDRLKKSQFITHVAVFCSYALRAALWAVDRAEQEFFLSTAVSRWSIWAHAEDRNYLPRKPRPSTGEISIQNLQNFGANTVNVPAYTVFYSTSGGSSNQYTNLSPVSLPAGTIFPYIAVSQIISKEIFFTVDVAKPFYQMFIPREYSATCTSFEVWVKDNNGDYAQWTYARRFRNSMLMTIFDEFYSHTDQIGIRFGNGEFGEILTEGTEIKVVLWLTNGDTKLLVGQQLSLNAPILDELGYPATLKMLVTTEISGGDGQEDIESARTNMLYHDLSDDLVWEQDYASYLRRKVSGLTWCVVYGEQEAEAITGPSVMNINKIFVSAYKVSGDINALPAQVISALGKKNPFGKVFEWVDPVYQYFTVAVTGKVPRGFNILEVNKTIHDAMLSAYGHNSLTRADQIFVNDIYAAVEATGYFMDQKAYFSVAVTGSVTPQAVNRMVGINIGESTFEVGYL